VTHKHGPGGAATPRGPAHKDVLVDNDRVPWALARVQPDGEEEVVAEYASFDAGWQAGTHLVTVEDVYGSYSLYCGGQRVARFAWARLEQAGYDTDRLPTIFGLLS
jgi:hypothetical protein